MTVIAAGLAPKGVAYMASDSQTSLGDQRVLTGSKIVHAENALIGVAGDSAAGAVLLELILEHLPGPLQTITPKVVKAEIPGDASALIVSAGGPIMLVDSDGAVVVPCARFFAIGSGAPYALGALEALQDITTMKDALAAGVDSACQFDTGCSQPVHIKRISP